MTLIHGIKSGVLFDGEIPGPNGFLWGFVSLEYYALILNRVRLILITNNELVALNAGGPIAAPDSFSEIWFTPFSFLSPRKMQRYERIVTQSEEAVRVNWANWKCSLSEVTNICFKEASKWGMGCVPYSGRLFLSANGRQCDFVLVGNQNGREIEDCIKSGKTPSPREREKAGTLSQSGKQEQP
jgi:hypothetical protein